MGAIVVILVILILLGGMIYFFASIVSINSSVKDIRKKLDKIDSRLNGTLFPNAAISRPSRIENAVPEEKTEKEEFVQPVKEEKEPEKDTEKDIKALQAAGITLTTVPPPLEEKPIAGPVPPPLSGAEAAHSEKRSGFEENAVRILNKIWMWIIVGEEYRNKNVSMEYAVASTWLLRSAIIIILTGGAFFLKYSIENNLVTPAGRVGISILAAVGMLVAGIKMTGKKYNIIGHGLAGGGIALLYFSIFAAAGIYKLIDTLPAFGLMIMITITAGIISVRANSLLIAILGVTGGYFTPVMLSTGEKNFIGLLTYLLMLGACTLYTARHKNWKLLNFMSFVFTYFLFFASMAKFYKPELDFAVAISYLSAFFLLFSCIHLIYNIMNKEKSSIIELFMMLANVSIYFAEAYRLVKPLYGYEYVALFSVALALFYIAQVWYFIKAKLEDKNLLIVLSGFASFFITVTVPLVLSKEWITAAWSIQALVFVWMSGKLKSPFIRGVAYAVYILVLDRFFLYDAKHFTCVSKELYWSGMFSRLITLGSYIASLAAAWKLISAEKNKQMPQLLGDSFMSKLLISASCVLLFIYLHFEIYYFSGIFCPCATMTLLTAIWFAALLIVALRIRGGKFSANYAWLLYALLAGLIVKFIVFDLNFWNISPLAKAYLCDYDAKTVLMRFLDFCPLVGLLAAVFMICRSKAIKNYEVFGIAALILLFAYLTFETGTLLQNFMPGMKEGGISVLWGIFAFFMLLGGIMKQIKGLRYTALALFIITILKIFLFDMSNLSQVYKFTAFIALGIVVLTGAFIYVRFKDFFSISTAKDNGNEKNK